LPVILDSIEIINRSNQGSNKWFSFFSFTFPLLTFLFFVGLVATGIGMSIVSTRKKYRWLTLAIGSAVVSGGIEIIRYNWVVSSQAFSLPNWEWMSMYIRILIGTGFLCFSILVLTGVCCWIFWMRKNDW
ncbi:MAG: hypothetical protein AAF226_04575, partial [Verrucomicrobiota bacterium]